MLACCSTLYCSQIPDTKVGPNTSKTLCADVLQAYNVSHQRWIGGQLIPIITHLYVDDPISKHHDQVIYGMRRQQRRTLPIGMPTAR